jgi:choloylglycine hydrolase
MSLASPPQIKIYIKGAIMCTAIVFGDNNRYFGRNLDYEVSFGERVVVTPRNYELSFRYLANMTRHAAMIGMAAVVDGYPLYYDATNEKGLSAAGLNFPGNADYKPYREGQDNVAAFELIPWVLGQCATVSEVRRMLERMNLLARRFTLTVVSMSFIAEWVRWQHSRTERVLELVTSRIMKRMQI